MHGQGSDGLFGYLDFVCSAQISWINIDTAPYDTIPGCTCSLHAQLGYRHTQHLTLFDNHFYVSCPCLGEFDTFMPNATSVSKTATVSRQV